MVIDQINAILPQTQCRQCGFQGCLPYAEAIALGRRTLRIIQFNVAFALIVKAVFLILAFTGHTSLWLAILADTGATLLVIMNALRLLGGAKNLK